MYRLWVPIVVLCCVSAIAPAAFAQTSPADVAADEVLAGPPDVEQPKAVASPQMPVLDLLLRGGILMWPIGFFSLVVVAVGIERALALRSSRVIPQRLVNRLGQLADSTVFDPRTAYHVCSQYPSSAARVVQAMLLKVGRPHAELEKAVADTSQREVDRMFANVRTLNLAANVAPLLGLLGTVQGMIQSFFITASLGPEGNRVQALSEGIYVALVTTFAGLCVAIPAAMLAHHFEGRILRMIHEVEALANAVLPQLERYEGKLRLDRSQLERNGEAPTPQNVTTPHAPLRSTPGTIVS